MFDVSLLDDPQRFVTNLTEIFRKVNFRDIDIDTGLVTGISHKREIVLDDFLGKIGYGGSGCKKSYRDLDIPFTPKTVDPVEHSDHLEWCYTETDASFLKYLQSVGVERPNMLTNAQLYAYVLDKVNTAIADSAKRKHWFSDEGLNAAVLTAAGDEPFYNKFDGLWAQLIDIGTANADQYVNMTTGHNDAVTKSAQIDVTPAEALAFIDSALAKFKEDARRYPEDFQMDLTWPLYNALEAYYRDNTTGNYADRDLVREKGDNGRYYYVRGEMKIVHNTFWSRVIQTDFDNGTTYHLPNRLLIANKQENMDAFLDVSSFPQSNKFFFDENEDMMKLKVRWKQDALVYVDDFVIVGY